MVERTFADNRWGPVGVLLGVEHEYRILDGAGQVVAARPLVAARGDEFGVRLDPSDVNAVRHPTGAVITVDGDEAEMASPLIRYDTSLARALAAATRTGTSAIASIARPATLSGYSTHVSASSEVTRAASARAVERSGELLRDVAGPMLAMLAEPRHGAGILVRPRHGRLEVCTEFVTGDDLAALAAFLGAAIVAVESPRLRAAMSALRLCTHHRPSVHRYGWFLDPSTHLGHWYREGRDALLDRANGGTITIGEQLAATWSLIRPIAAASLFSDVCRIVDARIDGSAPLPSERQEASEAPDADFEFRNILGPHRFGEVTLECLATTWTATVFSATDGRGATLLTVPTTNLVEFLDDCAATQTLADLMATRRRVRASVDERKPRRQHRVDPSSMVARERLPGGSAPPRLPGSRRSAKDRADHQPRSLRSARMSRVWPIAVGVGLTALVLGGVALTTQGDDSASSGTAQSVGEDQQVTGSTSEVATAGTSSDVATFLASGSFTSFESGLSQLPESARDVYIGVESSRGLWPAPQGEAVELGITLRGACDGVQPCTVDVAPFGTAAGNALFRFSFLIDSFPQLSFDMDPTGAGYSYHREMRWNTAAASAGFDACASGDPLETLDIEISLQGGDLIGSIAAGVVPLVIGAPGGCWGIAFVIDFSAQAA